MGYQITNQSMSIRALVSQNNFYALPFEQSFASEYKYNSTHSTHLITSLTHDEIIHQTRYKLCAPHNAHTPNYTLATSCRSEPITFSMRVDQIADLNL